MRKPIMAGNWKMNKTRDEALQFIYAVNQALPSNELVDSVICAPSILLRDLVKRQGEQLRIGAENMHFAESGAFTGEISPTMLTTTGVEYVILGHSERRAMFNETDETVNLKLKKALEHGLKPIVCVGENLEQRESGEYKELLPSQVKGAFKDVSAADACGVVIAYEPIWAIGTGKTASPEDADETCGLVRAAVETLYNKETAEAVRIQYGGSVKPANVDELMAKPNIDGALVGGASLKADSFIALVQACIK